MELLVYADVKLLEENINAPKESTEILFDVGMEVGVEM
jgi:hypothetical protein